MCRAPCFAPASCWATAAGRKPRSSTWCARLSFWRACRCCRCGPTTASISCPADYVADAVVHLHQKPHPEHEIYHLSVGNGLGDIPPADRRAGASARKDAAAVLAGTGRAVPLDGRLAVAAPRQRGPWRIAAESVSAVSGLEHGLRQRARGRRAGPRARAVFLLLLSACCASRARTASAIRYRDWPEAAQRAARVRGHGRELTARSTSQREEPAP